MPVPAPRFSKQPSHPVIKQNQSGDLEPTHPSVFQNLTRTLPVAPTGPPPSFGTREQWIKSLPSWRRTKPRRIWEEDCRVSEHASEQHFFPGLTVADNASVIKGTRAQACIPPLFTFGHISTLPPVISQPELRQRSEEDADDEMSSGYSIMGQTHFEHESQWSASSPAKHMEVEEVQYPALPTWGLHGATAVDTEEMYGAFSPPMFDDVSPREHEAASSPLEPATPFGEFVDRAVASQDYVAYSPNHSAIRAPEHCVYQGECGPECYQAQAYAQAEQPKEQPAVTEIATPSATTAYKKLAEPLADWVAHYVWKACTTGMSLPPAFSRHTGGSADNSYPIAPPSYLAASVHSLLLSTLLQPSAVFLALWYIVRLPVYFGSTTMGAEHVAELRFRLELLGDPSMGLDQDIIEANAPFQLILLGFMLANKWLDDHTFSNKTWHSISNVPIQSLNKLESLTLDIFNHDLSISQGDWSQWLNHVLSYHISLSTPSHPQPISRPSTNPHLIVRKAIEELIQAPVACSQSSIANRPEPVFLGLEERRKEKVEKEYAMAQNCIDALEIDLDEDGPLREEYLPKRRTSTVGSLRNSRGHIASKHILDKTRAWDPRHTGREILPPPAKWSPAGDEPILRERNRVSGHYVAVQPPVLSSFVGGLVPFQDPVYHNWSMGPGSMMSGYAYDPASMQHSQPVFNPYPFAAPMPITHSRSQSLSYDHDNSQAHNRPRTYSQSRFEHRFNDIRMSTNELPALSASDVHWAGASEQHGYSAPYIQTFAPHPGLDLHSNWLRA